MLNLRHLPKAKLQFKQVLKLIQKTNFEDKNLTLHIIRMQAGIIHNIYNYEEECRLMSNILQLDAKLLPHTNLAHLHDKHIYTKALYNLGKYTQVKEIFQFVLAGRKERLSYRHMETLHTLQCLGETSDKLHKQP